jgi:hemolysin III
MHKRYVRNIRSSQRLPKGSGRNFFGHWMNDDLMALMDDRPVGVAWNYDRTELLTDAIIHVAGLCLALLGAIALAVIACNIADGVEAASIVVYTAGLLAMLGLSAAYNLWPLSPRKWLLRRLDQSAIFLFIAATYTPFIAQMKGDVTTLGLFIGVWTAAAVGVLLKILAPGRYDRVSIVLYLLLGWSGLLALEPMLAALPRSSVVLLVAGGLLYSAGVGFHMWEKLRFQNAIWHAFVLVAAGCHYTAILDCVAFGQA